MERDNTRRQVLATLFVTTALFAAVVGGSVFLADRIPRWRFRQVETALAEGDFAGARALAERLGEEPSREALALCDYSEAARAMADGDWAGAAERFAALGNYADAAERTKECAYRAAEALFASGDWAGAAEAFRALAGYAGAAERADEAVYRQAEAAALTDRQEGMRLFLSLGGYADARERAVALARAITGEEDEETALALAQDLTPEEAALRAELLQVRRSLPGDIVDVGFYHTVGLRADGTVLACGDDTYGQCAVDGWTGVTAVAAGAYHTVGLRADGTVTAAGRNTEHQCDVGAWTDIVAIAAADYATFGLRSNGTVVCCGFNDYYMLSGWTGVTRSTGGSHNVGALRSGGEALSSHISSRSAELTGLVDLAVNSGFAVGLRPDGTVLSPQTALEDWTEIVAVSASGTAILGLRADGGVRAHFFRSGDALDTDALSGVRALAAGGTHSAFVLADGTVTVLGENDRGQAETEDWRLF